MKRVDILGHNFSNLLEEEYFVKECGGQIDSNQARILMDYMSKAKLSTNEVQVFMGLVAQDRNLFHLHKSDGILSQFILSYDKYLDLAEKDGSFFYLLHNQNDAIAKILEINQEYAKNGATILSPHAFRMGAKAEILESEDGAQEIVTRSQDEILRNLALTEEILIQMNEQEYMKLGNTKIGINLAGMFPIGNPVDQGIDFFEEHHRPVIERISQRKSKGYISHVWSEATTTVNEVIALGKLCAEYDLEYDCSFILSKNVEDEIVIPDPRNKKKGIKLIEAMKEIDMYFEKLGIDGVHYYGLNCGEDRVVYEDAMKEVLGEHESTSNYFKDRFKVFYPNKGRALTGVNQGGTFKNYEDYGSWFKRILKEYSFLEIIGVCCGSCPHTVRDVVTQIEENNLRPMVMNMYARNTTNS